MPNDSLLVETVELVKRYPMGRQELVALKGISLQFRRGEFSGVIGPLGSGKTTLLNIIGTLDVPSAGSVWARGETVERLAPAGAGRD